MCNRRRVCCTHSDKGSVEQHNGNLCGNVLDVLVLLLIGTDEVGTNENNAIHFLGKNEV